jgi:hypothetical protein
LFAVFVKNNEKKLRSHLDFSHELKKLIFAQKAELFLFQTPQFSNKVYGIKRRTDFTGNISTFFHKYFGWKGRFQIWGSRLVVVPWCGDGFW